MLSADTVTTFCFWDIIHITIKSILLSICNSGVLSIIPVTQPSPLSNFTFSSFQQESLPLYGYGLLNHISSHLPPVTTIFCLLWICLFWTFLIKRIITWYLLSAHPCHLSFNHPSGYGRWYLIVVLVFTSLMMLSTFSSGCWPFVHLLWEKVYSNFACFYQLGCLTIES